jgi:type II secretory pathway pseudopilin PulG
MRGQTIVELLLVIGLSAIILPALLTGLVASRSGKAQQSQRLEAVALLKETEEAVRNVREKDWNTFAVNGTYYPTILGSSWVLTPCPCPAINGFTRSVVISDVERNASGVIVASGGTVDPSSKKLVITVSWGTPLATSIQSTIYLMRLDNITYVETTEAQFNNGTKTGVAVTNTSGGEITLGGGGQGDWCQPATPSGSLVLDLPKNGAANALTAIEGRAFAGTGENASGVSFANITIGNNPPNPSIAGTFDGYKTNDVFGETNYAYIATDSNSKEIVIIDLNNIVGGKYQEVGYFNAPGNGSGNSVFVAGNVGYMTSGNKFYTFNLSSKSGSRPAIDPGGAVLSGVGKKIVVVGSYAYVAVDDVSGEITQMEIVKVEQPWNLFLSGGHAHLPALGGQDLFVNSDGTRTYIVTKGSSDPTKKEFFVLDSTSKTTHATILGQYDANGMDPKGVTVVTGNKAIVVGDGGEEYQVIDITNESSPNRCGGLNTGSDINGISSVLESDGDAYSYIIAEDANEEFQIIAGGPGGQYASEGTFESQTIPIPMPVNNTSFNRFEVNVNRPSQTNIKFQVAVSPAVGGSCSGVTFNFVGTDGTNSTFFETSVTSGTQTFGYAIPTPINPGQCFRYKIFLSTTDSTQTPIFYDITVNYAP